MKTQSLLLAIAAIVLIAAGSCRKETPGAVQIPDPEIEAIQEPIFEPVVLTINSGIPKTKTAISGTDPTWKSGDKLTVVYTNTSDAVTTARSTALASDTEEATFSVTLLSPKTAVSAYAYYPANLEAATESEALPVIPGRQYPTGSSFDGAADILISKPFTPSGSISTQFRRLGAVLKIQITSDLIGADYLKKVLVTADTPLAGKVSVDMAEAVATGISSGSNSVVAE